MNSKQKLLEIEKKLDDGQKIQCPSCYSGDTKKIYQAGLSYQYRCNNCLKIHLIDILWSTVNINGEDGELEFILSDNI